MVNVRCRVAQRSVRANKGWRSGQLKGWWEWEPCVYRQPRIRSLMVPAMHYRPELRFGREAILICTGRLVGWGWGEPQSSPQWRHFFGESVERGRRTVGLPSMVVYEVWAGGMQPFFVVPAAAQTTERIQEGFLLCSSSCPFTRPERLRLTTMSVNWSAK